MSHITAVQPGYMHRPQIDAALQNPINQYIEALIASELSKGCTSLVEKSGVTLRRSEKRACLHRDSKLSKSEPKRSVQRFLTTRLPG